MTIPFKIGELYNRQADIHDTYGGSRQSGMSPSADHPYLFLFTGPQGEQHGYEDRYSDSGTFLYTGAGQIGDMVFKRGNKALRDHIKDKKHALLFRDMGKATYRYEGELTYIDHHLEPRLDTEGNMRQAIIFELANETLEETLSQASEPAIPENNIRLKDKLSKDQLRELAIQGSSTGIAPTTRKVRTRVRSDAIKRYAKARANGRCESCLKESPFLDKKNQPFLEVHHLNRLADGGPDAPDCVAAICPNCHREIHTGIEGNDKNALLKLKISKLEGNGIP